VTHIELDTHTFDDGETRVCLFFDEVNGGVLPLPAEDAVLLAALLSENLDAYDQVIELARTILGLGYSDGMDA